MASDALSRMVAARTEARRLGAADLVDERLKAIDNYEAVFDAVLMRLVREALQEPADTHRSIVRVANPL